MITRAQAEALLTLAESLEACERLQVNVKTYLSGQPFGREVAVCPDAHYLRTDVAGRSN